MLSARRQSRSAFEEAITYIYQRWEEGKSLKQIADMFGVDQGNLSREFRHRFSISPKEYLDWRRMEYVCEKLRLNHMMGYQLGSELGFLTDIAFYRWVKRIFGCSFTQLQNEMQPFCETLRNNPTYKKMSMNVLRNTKT